MAWMVLGLYCCWVVAFCAQVGVSLHVFVSTISPLVDLGACGGGPVTPVRLGLSRFSHCSWVAAIWDTAIQLATWLQQLGGCGTLLGACRWVA